MGGINMSNITKELLQLAQQFLDCKDYEKYDIIIVLTNKILEDEKK